MQSFAQFKMIEKLAKKIGYDGYYIHENFTPLRLVISKVKLPNRQIHIHTAYISTGKKLP